MKWKVFCKEKKKAIDWNKDSWPRDWTFDGNFAEYAFVYH